MRGRRLGARRQSVQQQLGALSCPKHVRIHASNARAPGSGVLRRAPLLRSVRGFSWTGAGSTNCVRGSAATFEPGVPGKRTCLRSLARRAGRASATLPELFPSRSGPSRSYSKRGSLRNASSVSASRNASRSRLSLFDSESRLISGSVVGWPRPPAAYCSITSSNVLSEPSCM